MTTPVYLPGGVNSQLGPSDTTRTAERVTTTSAGGVGGVPGQTGSGPTGVDQATADAISLLGPYLPWMPPELLTIYAASWVDTGDYQLAIAHTRSNPAYDKYFPGNRRDDGSFRFDEQEYLANIEAYENVLLSINLNPDVLRHNFVKLIEGSVSPVEFVGRVEAVFQRVYQAAPEVQAYYAQQAGIDMTLEAMVASVLDPTVGQQIINRQLTVAEIGGAASVAGFRLAGATANRLAELNIGLDTATQTFNQGKELIPVLDTLAQRHFDPDDTFDIEEFTQATLLDDPNERRRLRRLLSQERSMFTQRTSFDQQGGRVAGLIDT